MTFSTHSASAPLFLHSLENMLSWLDKAEEHAKSSGFEANNYLGLRLTPGMLPLSRQIQVATETEVKVTLWSQIAIASLPSRGSEKLVERSEDTLRLTQSAPQV